MCVCGYWQVRVCACLHLTAHTLCVVCSCVYLTIFVCTRALPCTLHECCAQAGEVNVVHGTPTIIT